MVLEQCNVYLTIATSIQSNGPFPSKAGKRRRSFQWKIAFALECIPFISPTFLCILYCFQREELVVALMIVVTDKNYSEDILCWKQFFVLPIIFIVPPGVPMSTLLPLH
jgi:hypothetical protein